MFSLLPTLKNGDEIDVNYDGVSYIYKVENMFEVLPTDIQVLDQNYSDSFLTLVTCVPPGDPANPKRLIVRARVVPLTD
jgi:sortase A